MLRFGLFYLVVRRRDGCVWKISVVEHKYLRSITSSCKKPEFANFFSVWFIHLKYTNPGGDIAQWLERELTNRKLRSSNPTSASRFLLSRIGQLGSIPALMLPSGGMIARHREDVIAERYKQIPLDQAEDKKLN
ncbi:hypothetical protein CSKR_112089 [Clonorchis sinensis]|uniref:Uncharacterized protein n=1 Tax=Clonorchis sinensis TaxID=79923 RepID=A0A419QCR5_CLOSI|nr:hypothetical protein CSKR_112089 [Clonorchis sinensis]